MPAWFRCGFALVVLTLLVGCSDEPEPGPVLNDAIPFEAPEPIRIAVMQQTQAFCTGAEQLQESVGHFLDGPASDTLQLARLQWVQTHMIYAQLMVVYQLANLSPPHIQSDRDAIDADPLLPGYLDRVPGYPRSGLVYSEVPLTPGFLRQEHQSTDFYYLTLGLHPLEVMLWGGIDQRPEHRAELFVPAVVKQEDRVDARARRKELLRLIAHALPRDAALFCVHSNQLELMHALSARLEEPASQLRATAGAVTALIDRPLAEWQTHPDGVNRNGMPIWHSLFAKTDFDRMAAQLQTLRTTWLPAVLKSDGSLPESGMELIESMAALEAVLADIGKTRRVPAPEAVTQARALAERLLTQLQEAPIPDPAMPAPGSPAPASKEAGQ